MTLNYDTGEPDSDQAQPPQQGEPDQPMQPASPDDMKVYQGIADNYHSSRAAQPLSEEQDREAFEKWAAPITALAKENGSYVEVMTSLAWEAWQARAAHNIGSKP